MYGKPLKFVVIYLLFAVQVAIAKDFGVVGTTFAILEPDMLQYIKGKLIALENSGELAKLNKKMQQQMEAYVNEPQAVTGITQAIKITEKMFDPSYIVAEDILDQDGKVMHAKGTRVNPLEHMPLNVNLYFIDGNKKEQVEWSLAQINNSSKPSKLILVAGNHLKIVKQVGFRVYFDQKGLLTNRLGIKAVPAQVTQQENLLKIVEGMQ